MPEGLKFPLEYQTLILEKLYLEPGRQFNLHQFVQEIERFDVKKGHEVKIQGFKRIEIGDDVEAEFTLPSLSHKISDNPEQYVEEFEQSFTMKEYLLKNAVMVQEWEQRHALHDIVGVHGTALADTYHKFREKMIAGKFANSPFTRYANNKATAAAMTIADKFTFSDFLLTQAELKQLDIPTYPDGTYVCLINEATKATLFNEEAFQTATLRAFQAQAPVFTGELGVISNIRFVLTQSFADVTGDSDGTPFNAARATMFGTGIMEGMPLNATNLESQTLNWMNGNAAGPITKVTGMKPEVRVSNETDYDRFLKMTWLEHAGYGVMDPTVEEFDDTTTQGEASRYIRHLIGATDLSAAL